VDESKPNFSLRPPPSGAYERSQFMQLRCAECRHLFEAEVPIHVDVSVYAEALMSIACPSCGGKRILLGQGRTRAEDAAYPWGGTVGERAAHWFDNGEHGTSSLAIHERMTGIPQASTGTPCDPSDLRRCVLLLIRIPEWDARMDEMAEVSEGWRRLAAEWERLTDTFLSEVGYDLDHGPAPRTRALIDAILSGAPAEA
jgi:ribosomal protein S27E